MGSLKTNSESLKSALNENLSTQMDVKKLISPKLNSIEQSLRSADNATQILCNSLESPDAMNSLEPPHGIESLKSRITGFCKRIETYLLRGLDFLLHGLDIPGPSTYYEEESPGFCYEKNYPNLQMNPELYA